MKLGAKPNSDEIAIAALAFIAGDANLLSRFLAITGLSPSMIRAAATEPGFLAGVVTFIMAHEPTLLEFALHAGIEPSKVAKALRDLPQGNETST